MHKLYKKTATGAVQVWWQEQQGHRYRTHSGQVGGQIVTSAWTEAQAKNVGRSNETTPIQQASLEVDSNYTKKTKEGYLPSIGEAEASTKFKPMLAKNYDDYHDKVWVAHCSGSYVLVQPKLDGIRCIATSSGLFSRLGNPIVATPHIMEALRPVFRSRPGLIIDGELYNHDLREDFNAIVSLTKKTKLTDLDIRNSEEMIEYHIFDVAGSAGEESTHARIQSAHEVANLTGMVAVSTAVVHDRDELDAYYASYLDAGYEGQMIRISGPYEQKRSSLLLKRKEFVDSEFVVVDIEEGVGNAAGGAKIAHLRLDTNPDVIFKADITGTVAERKDILRRRAEYIGGQATVKYFAQRTPDGIPRFGKVKTFHVGRRKL
jgi:DNA ligase-1